MSVSLNIVIFLLGNLILRYRLINWADIPPPTNTMSASGICSSIVTHNQPQFDIIDSIAENNRDGLQKRNQTNSLRCTSIAIRSKGALVHARQTVAVQHNTNYAR